MKWRKQSFASDYWLEAIDEEGRIVGKVELPTYGWQQTFPAFAIDAAHPSPYTIGEYETEAKAKMAVERAVGAA